MTSHEESLGKGMQVKKKKLVSAVLAVGAAVAVMAVGGITVANSYPSASLAMTPFDAEAPGRGLDLFAKKVVEHAVVYGLYASSAALLSMDKEARHAADWLVQNPANREKMGWGLPFAWDAFGDKSVNPITTVYGVTVAMAVRGLFDVYDQTGDESYRDAAVQALNDYLPYFHETEDGGYFGYSDQPTDQKEVYNISSVLMGQYARAYHYTQDNRFLDVAQKAKSQLDESRRTVGDDVYWTYTSTITRPNDSVHAAFTVQGYLDYAKYLDKNLDVSREVSYLARFFDGDTIKEFPDHAGLSTKVMALPARGWGVGMLAYTLADSGDIQGGLKVARALEQYGAGNGVYAMTPGTKEFAPRVQAHVTMGLAKLQQASRTQCALAFFTCL
ncbi:hypothetical protein [Pseudomonas sp.]|uniref:hypothetical protein n=1 Tax=Pseudomonas sp. TaxID=306 RepID=UPI003C71FE3D